MGRGTWRHPLPTRLVPGLQTHDAVVLFAAHAWLAPHVTGLHTVHSGEDATHDT
jgi:hypothetical protein